MSDSDLTLETTQQQLKRLIVAPNGVATALAEAGEPAARQLASLVRSDARLAAVDRLEVYANAYFYRIRDCLIDDFGALHAALGADLFHDLVTAYLLACTPRHPSLRFAGDRLAGYLANAAAAAPFRRALPWAPDLARLEWALIDAFDVADAPVVPRSALAEIAPERWAELRFVLHPSLQLLEVAFPVHASRRAFDREEPAPETLTAEAGSLVVWRNGERPSYREVDALEADGLRILVEGASFGALCVRVAGEKGDDAAPTHAAALLARWQADGLLARLID